MTRVPSCATRDAMLGVDTRALYGEIPGMRFVPLQEGARMRDEVRREVAGQSLFQRIVFEAFAGHKVGWMIVLDDGAGDGDF